MAFKSECTARLLSKINFTLSPVFRTVPGFPKISAAVDPGAHAVLIVDQAGWHLSPKLAIPDNITILPCRHDRRS